jgi:AcrR family transcriptional regulator
MRAAARPASRLRRVDVVYPTFVQHYDVMAQSTDGRGGRPGRLRRASYHHGDLPNALADAATDMARAGGPDAVVLRAAARAAGVSAAAAYRHFADHDELLAVVRRRALDALEAAMRQSLDSVTPLPDPAQQSVQRLRALGLAYITFALTDPGLFRTAFCRPDKPRADAADRMPATGPYALLSGVLDELVEHGVLEVGRRAGAEIPAWAAVHGLATLLLDGPLALISAEERGDAIERTSDFMLNGIKGPER